MCRYRTPPSHFLNVIAILYLKFLLDFLVFLSFFRFFWLLNVRDCPYCALCLVTVKCTLEIEINVNTHQFYSTEKKLSIIKNL